MDQVDLALKTTLKAYSLPSMEMIVFFMVMLAGISRLSPASQLQLQDLFGVLGMTWLIQIHCS